MTDQPSPQTPAHTAVLVMRQLLTAPSSQVSPEMRAEIFNNWSSVPTLEQVVHTRNSAAYTSECSDFVVGVLNLLIEILERPDSVVACEP